jgi:hypothetical protein
MQTRFVATSTFVGIVVMLVAFGVPTDAAAELNSEEIQALRQRGGEDSFRQLRQDWRDGGSQRAEALQAAIEIATEAEGLDLAREALDRNRPGYLASDLGAVMNGIGRYTSEDAHELVRVETATLRSERSLEDFDHVARVWAGMYFRRHGADEKSYIAAVQEAADDSLGSLERGLRLRVLASVGRGKDSAAREFALKSYRPYLEHPDVDLRLAALSVNSALWDWEVIPQLKLLAEAPRDPWVRSKSRDLVARYLMSGPDRPGPGQTVLSPAWRARHAQPWDPDGHREWMERASEWNAEQHRLLTGEPLPPTLPEPPSVPLYGRSTDPSSENASAPRPLTTLPGSELPLRP